MNNTKHISKIYINIQRWNPSRQGRRSRADRKLRGRQVARDRSHHIWK